MVIGGSGFFGKSILDAYRRGILSPWKVDRIIVISRNAGSLRNTHPNILNDSITLINDNISTYQKLPFADFVIHAAASTDAANYLLQPFREKAYIKLAVLNYCALAKKYHKKWPDFFCL